VPQLGDPAQSDWVEPRRAACLVPISSVHAASVRALVYARSLGFAETTAVFFSSDEADAAKIKRDWSRYSIPVPLEIVDAPFRDLGEPIRAYIGRITADPGSVAVVVMPELVVHGTDRLLHNQRALYLKRLLLFEPRVILASVPYQLH